MSDLCTIEDARAYLGLEGSPNDGILLRLIEAVSAEIVAWCGQPLVAVDGNVTHRFVGTYGYEVLPYFPVQSVESVVYVTGIGETETVSPTSYELRRGRLYSSSVWSGAEYTAVLTVGALTVPADVAQVAIEMVAVRAKDSFAREDGQQLGAGRLGKTSEGVSVGGGSQTTVYARPDWQLRLAPYRVVTV